MLNRLYAHFQLYPKDFNYSLKTNEAAPIQAALLPNVTRPISVFAEQSGIEYFQGERVRPLTEVVDIELRNIPV